MLLKHISVIAVCPSVLFLGNWFYEILLTYCLPHDTRENAFLVPCSVPQNISVNDGRTTYMKGVPIRL